MRLGLFALVCAAVGGVAALAIGRGAGLLGGGTTTVARTVVAPAAPRPAPPVAAAAAGSFDAARVYRLRSPGVVTIFSSFGGTAAQGSGFVVSAAGTILTNAHVITTAGEATGPATAASAVYVEFADQDRVPASIVGWDVFDDVGVLRVDPGSHALRPLPLGRSSTVTVGEPVAAIGSPLANPGSLTVGVISAVHRSIAALTAANFDLTDAIQTDAPIAHGSSGGPLLDARGRVIGIIAQIRSDQSGSTGIGFAVPIDSARRSLRQLLTKGKVEYAYAGIQAEDVTPSLARRLGLGVRRGALVDRVTPGGPAARAGIRGGSRQETVLGEPVVVGGDVIVAIDGLPVDDAEALVRIVTTRLQPGVRARFAVVRGGRRLVVPVLLAARRAG